MDRTNNQATQSKQTSESAGSPMDQAKEAVGEYAEKGKEQADAGIDKAASGLQKAADKMRGQMSGQDGMQAEAGTRIADGMEKTATYLREHNSDEVMDDLERFVKEHPMQALAGAAIGGFLISRVLL